MHVTEKAMFPRIKSRIVQKTSDLHWSQDVTPEADLKKRRSTRAGLQMPDACDRAGNVSANRTANRAKASDLHWSQVHLLTVGQNPMFQ